MGTTDSISKSRSWGNVGVRPVVLRAQKIVLPVTVLTGGAPKQSRRFALICGGVKPHLADAVADIFGLHIDSWRWQGNKEEALAAHTREPT